MTCVLFTCSGQRVDVLLAFRNAGARTVAADTSPLSPTLYHADVPVTPPRVSDPGYVSFLADAVRDHGVELIVPLTDIDQLVLARHRDELGTLLLLPDLSAIELTRDKYRAHLFFEQHGIDTPPTWLPGEVPADVELPVLVKARFGFGSRHIYRATTAEELDFFLGYSPVETMVQRLCDGEEYSIDVFCDMEGRCLSAIPRTMIESKGGESIKGTTVADALLVEVGRHVSEALRLAGPATVQCFRTPDGRHEVTDVNARFGGAFPLPRAAGGGYPELALALARGERPEPRLGAFQAGVTMTRFFWHLCLEEGGEGAAPLADGLPAAGTVGDR